MTELTLRSWRLSDEEIDLLRAEAERIHRGEDKPEKKVEKSWAEVEIRAPLDGVILEENAAVGDLVDTDLALFVVADTRTLAVSANAYEEDLPALQSLRREDQRWTIRLKSDAADAPGTAARFDSIGSLIDPTQHTCPVRGWMPNPDEGLKGGQYITATVDLPAQPNEVAVPEGAVVLEGAQSTVFIASDSSGKKVARRPIAVVRRANKMVIVRSQPTAEDKSRGCEPLSPGEWIVTAGTIELAGALQDRLALVQNNVQNNEKK
jgi:cobalt-zinc-cadmium efflux system membrane fusion protein